MKKFTGNYATTNSNFVIQNLKEGIYKDIYLPTICVLKNILQRNKVVIPSQYLKSVMGDITYNKNLDEQFYLIDKIVPNWIGTIKGDSIGGKNPAEKFFYNIIPKYFSKYDFIQQLILPEAEINEIVDKKDKRFLNQRVDFYLSQARLVIEIDGYHHREDSVTKISDAQRDRYLNSHGIKVIRINTEDLNSENESFLNIVHQIKDYLSIYDDILMKYKKSFNTPFKSIYGTKNYKKLILTAVMRFQITILSLIENGTIKLNDFKWEFNILNNDVYGYEDIAIEDLFIWLENIFNIQGIKFIRPKVYINYCDEKEDFDFSCSSINIDFSILKRWTYEYKVGKNKNIIFVRNDYFDSANYFRVSISDNIVYDFSNMYTNRIDSLKFLLKNIFEFDDFKKGQLNVITNILEGKDTIGILPTGAGKSLCYQLSALLQPGICVVVVPIKSLMYDQKQNLDNICIGNSQFLNSDQVGEEKENIINNFSNRKYQFLWGSPERFQSEKFREVLKNLNTNKGISYVVIDEIHCLSEWGHDFRTSYLTISKTIRRCCDGVNILGLTATASANVLKDIQIEFSISRENVKTLLSFTRPELKFKVILDDSINQDTKYEKLLKIISEKNANENILKLNGEDTKCGIIFTVNVNGKVGCYDIASELQKDLNVDVGFFSGSSPKNFSEDYDRYKLEIQDKFKKNEISLLVATKAFGMGIDKQNVRYTIHYGLPGSLEALYQEAGRAGRDGNNSECYIIYSKESTQFVTKDDYNKLFNQDTTRDEIEKIVQKVKWNGKDIFRNLFLWLSSNDNVRNDFKIIKKIIYIFNNNTGEFILSAKDIKIYDTNKIEKALYRLYILGIIDDWTIEDWHRGIYKVIINNYNEDKLRKNLINYITKYQKDFDLDFKNPKNNEEIRYQKILESSKFSLSDKYIIILLRWIYDNMAYGRRQSLKTLVDLCNNFKDEEKFKRQIESYFKFDDGTNILDIIVENPNDYSLWFQLLFDKKREKIIQRDEAESLKNSISRYLESYRYNVGLNFIDGITRLYTNDKFLGADKNRFFSALKEISFYDEKSQKDIMKGMFTLVKDFSENSKLELSEGVIKFSLMEVNDVYEGLKDKYSLSLIMSDFLKRLKNINERLI